jgi:hypothetical protein
MLLLESRGDERLDRATASVGVVMKADVTARIPATKRTRRRHEAASIAKHVQVEPSWSEMSSVSGASGRPGCGAEETARTTV